MEIKRKYTDDLEADKGAIHLMITRWCGYCCPLCCNKQYDLFYGASGNRRRAKGCAYRYDYWWRTFLFAGYYWLLCSSTS